MVLRLPQGHEGSEYVLSFEIGQQVGGFCSARTDRRIEPPSTALLYIQISVLIIRSNLHLFVSEVNLGKVFM